MATINRIGGVNPAIPEVTTKSMYAGKVGTLMTNFEDDDAVTKKFVDDIIDVLSPSVVDPNLYLDKSGVRAMTGPLNVRDFPKTDLEAVNNGYVNGVAAPAQTSLTLELVLPDVKKTLDELVAAPNSLLDQRTLFPGAIMQTTDPNTPVSYLRLNGATLDSAEYPGLYAVLGDRFYKAPPTIGSGVPWKNQYDFNNAANTDITGWTRSDMNLGVYAAIAFATKNKVYRIGGFLSNGVVILDNACYDINPDGTLQPSVNVVSFPRPIATGSALVFNNTVYIIGGVFGDFTVSSDVYKATINPDGTLGAWSIHNTLPAPLTFNHVFKAKDKVYTLGGGHSRSTVTTSVYMSTLNPDGTLGAWTTVASLPTPVAYGHLAVIADYVYLIGGDNASVDGGAYIYRTDKIYRATINADGTLGTWTLYGTVPVAISYGQTVVTKNRIFIMGGYRAGLSSTSNLVYTAPIDSSGNIGSWTTCTSLYTGLAYSQVVVTNGKVHLFGGVPPESGAVPYYYTGNLPGGLNDYSPYYSSGLNAGEFMLPDYTDIDTAKPGQHSYIKFA